MSPEAASWVAATVLVVEDEDRVREVVRAIFENHSYLVLAARHGADALAVLQRHHGPIDLLVTDVVMPELGGRGLADQLASAHPDMKVLFISGHPDEVIREHGLLRPGMSLLRKPFTPQELLQRVRELLAEP